MQFGAKPLFENISVKFGDGNRYGLIGANGCGKTTFMRILEGKLTPTSGNVAIGPSERLGSLSQDQFAFEEFNVIDTVIMGHAELWEIKQERDRIYALPEMSDADGMKVAELEIQFAEMDGYTAESRAGELLMGAGIAEELHFGPMKEVAPGWKLRSSGAGSIFRPRHPVIRRAYQQSRHKRYPLVRRRIGSSQMYHGNYFSRPALSEFCVYAYGRYRFW